jgi:hypothetical protein
MATLESEQIIAKIKTLVAKWKDKPEAVRGSREWFQRRGDRVIYRMLREKLQKINGGQKYLLTPDDEAWWNP